jgi:hypothetical protein
VGLTSEQSASSFSDDELYILAFGNTQQANACRELLAYRQRDKARNLTERNRQQPPQQSAW